MTPTFNYSRLCRRFSKTCVTLLKHTRHFQIRNIPFLIFIFLMLLFKFNTYFFSKSTSHIFSLSSSILSNIPIGVSDGYNNDFSNRLQNFSMEIFSAPKPFIGSDAIANKHAIKSWLRLHPKPAVTLLGYETGYDRVSAELGIKIERRLDKSFLGVPLFNSMFEHANKSEATVAIIVNGDILLFDDFMITLKRIISTFEDFLIISARHDVDSIPGDFDEADPEYTNRVRDHVWKFGTLHTYGGIDVWAWNTAGQRLFDPVMPPFVFGRGKYDNWFTHETISAGRRQVIDATETCLAVHLKHGYHFIHDQVDGKGKSLSSFWSIGKHSKFELFINVYLSLHVGSYSNQKGTGMHAPWKLANCVEADGMCLIKRLRPGSCPCEFSSFTYSTQTDPVNKPGTNIVQCGTVSGEHQANFSIPVRVPQKVNSVKYDIDEDDNLIKGQAKIENHPFGLPLTLTTVLEKVAINKTIVLSALDFGYRNIMMNWVCNLRQLGISNFIIASLDEELYKYAFIRSLPTYFEPAAFNGENRNELSHSEYGSDAFKTLSRLKSRVVLRVLKKGYNVLWTDCDIVFFKNPLLDLWNYNVDIAIQSNAPDDEPLNGFGRTSSGFYLAKSNKETINTFKEIIKYALESRISEQQCFYDVMCGKNMHSSVGDDMCKHKDTSIRLLDRTKYPNGITESIWNTADGEIPLQWPHLYILHNNWIKGAEKKQRLKRHGFTFVNEETEICNYSLKIK